MDRKGLSGTCRFCGERVRYGYLPDFPEGHPNYQPRYGGRRASSACWNHFQNELGQELKCLDSKGKVQRPAPKEYCTETLQIGYGNICNRVIKNTELYMCGIHSAKVRKRQEQDDLRNQSRDVTNYIRAETAALQETLKERFGIDSTSEYNWRLSAFTGNIIINPRELLSFLEEIFDA